MGKKRLAEGIPLNEIVYSLGMIKVHLLEYVQFSGMADSAVELHGDRELQRLVGRFFDKAVYYTVEGYEKGAEWQRLSASEKRVA